MDVGHEGDEHEHCFDCEYFHFGFIAVYCGKEQEDEICDEQYEVEISEVGNRHYFSLI